MRRSLPVTVLWARVRGVAPHVALPPDFDVVITVMSGRCSSGPVVLAAAGSPTANLRAGLNHCDVR